MSDLVAFLNARLDEDEREANLLLADGVPNSASMAHTPARTLREVEAKRRILADHLACEEWNSEMAQKHEQQRERCETLRALVAVYSDHPDYDPAWSVG